MKLIIGQEAYYYDPLAWTSSSKTSETSLICLTEYLETSVSFTRVCRLIMHGADELLLVTQMHVVDDQKGTSECVLWFMRVCDVDPPDVFTAFVNDLLLIIIVVDSAPALVPAWRFLYKVKKASTFIVRLDLYTTLQNIGMLRYFHSAKLQ